jgi:hypothetical protein
MSLMSPVSDTNRKFFFSISSPKVHEDKFTILYEPLGAKC